MKRKGISLIVLVITIIVIIILAGAVILSLANNNPISSATEATFKANLDAYSSDLNLTLSKKYLDNFSFNPNTLNASSWDGSSNITGTIKEYIPNITVEDGAKYGISAGKLVYCGSNQNEKQWITKAGLSTGIFNYSYAGVEQTFIAPVAGNYKVELWGAKGGPNTVIDRGGYGGYTSGKIYLTRGETLYVYVGDSGYQPSNLVKPFNGGGAPDITGDWEWSHSGNYSGGGATDIRLTSGLWDNIDSLRSRIMVAGGGAGGNSGDGSIGGSGGGLIGGSTTQPISLTVVNGATQTLGFAFGVGQPSGYADTGAGGGGYYGGYKGVNSNCGGSGGSSFISGHLGCDAINLSGVHTGQANHFSGKVFTSTTMIDGDGYNWTNAKGVQVAMPNPNGGSYSLGTGNDSDGYARITYLDN